MNTERQAASRSHPNSPRRIASTVLSVALLASAATSHAQDSMTDTINRMVTEGSISLNLRYRYEAVDQNNILSDARASTLRSRLTLQSAAVNNIDFLLEMDNVQTLGANHYDSFMDNRYRGSHSIIADPVGTEVNQARVRYNNDSHTAQLGRQRINHANQRFLGGVGWRQNEQTYDAVSYQYDGQDFRIDYSWLWNVNRIFDGSGNSAQAVNLDSDSHAILASTDIVGGTLSGWLYALDFDNAAALSSLTYGIGFDGSAGPVGISAAWARQQDHGQQPSSYSADYLKLELSTSAGPVNLAAAWESLGSDDGRIAFSTPLATLHAWQGFTDLFLNTPADGLQDLSLRASTRLDKLSLSLGWHDFSADHGSTDYGREWNLVTGYTVNESINLQLKLARYSSRGHAVDTDKVWFTVNMAF